MPTKRPRHIVTETDAVAHALDEAARVWPEEAHSRSRLLVRLVEAGYLAVSEQAEVDRQRRLAAIEEVAGALTGAYEPDYLERLREDWPA